MGERLSVLDIAWFIYAFRLSLAGYPFARLHPHVAAWEEKLRARPEFAKEIAGTRKPASAGEHGRWSRWRDSSGRAALLALPLLLDLVPDQRGDVRRRRDS